MATESTRVSPNALYKLAADAARSAELVFREKGWTWDRCEGVPDVADIAASLQSLLASACELEDASVGSGRLHVNHWFEDGGEHFSVSLELASASKNPQTQGDTAPRKSSPKHKTINERNDHVQQR